jgi:hypothetical protein
MATISDLTVTWPGVQRLRSLSLPLVSLGVLLLRLTVLVVLRLLLNPAFSTASSMP